MASQDKVNDPVCGMTVDRQDAKSLRYQGVRYYFCGEICREKFKEAPERYTRKAREMN